MTDNNGFDITTLELGPMENFIYLIRDKASNRTAVVDPAWDTNEILKTANDKGMIITDILLTHSHHDHINGVSDILDKYDAQLHLMKPEAKFWGADLSKPCLHHGGDIIKLGDTEIKALLTPGHTPGSACYHVGNDLIAGDTLFVFGCGRCDLSGGDPEQMYDTLRHIKKDLPGNTVVHPGHNYSQQSTSTIAEEIEGNPFMHFDDMEKFRHYRMDLHDKCRHDPYGPVLKKDLDC